MINKQTNIMKYKVTKTNLPKSIKKEMIAVAKTTKVISIIMTVLFTLATIVTSITLANEFSYILFSFMLILIFGVIIFLGFAIDADKELKTLNK